MLVQVPRAIQGLRKDCGCNGETNVSIPADAVISKCVSDNELWTIAVPRRIAGEATRASTETNAR